MSDILNINEANNRIIELEALVVELQSELKLKENALEQANQRIHGLIKVFEGNL